ncbi:uncharacterized protein LOC132306379 isoform X2 [Cornus florida]|uniref:uncharacterized protein LOC132306379 isoform X2 n=1 Tax=Cornus florida TaxID=4283 RepID=UPI00289D44E7|nr:uncharacterized protein LOC132306379 isoform X2 [Cornus florida]
MITTAQFISCAKPPNPPNSSISPSLPPKPSLASYHSLTFLGFNSLPTKPPCTRIKGRSQRVNLGTNASGVESPSTTDTERWLLEPVGDGDTKHIGFKVAMPNAFEIASSVVTVGRVPEKADMVIPVATVSGLHARIQKQKGILLVTDLDSTNGTYIDERRLRPGAVAPVTPGSVITFGDTHLAMFRVSKLENVEVSDESEDSEAKPETEDPSDN